MADVQVPYIILNSYAQQGVTREAFLCFLHLTCRYNEGRPATSHDLEDLADKMGYGHVNSVRGLIKFLAEKGLIKTVPAISVDELQPGPSFNGCCSYCGKSYPLLHRHHIIPTSQGGQDREENITYLCPWCHRLAHSPKYIPTWKVQLDG